MRTNIRTCWMIVIAILICFVSIAFGTKANAAERTENSVRYNAKNEVTNGTYSEPGRDDYKFLGWATTKERADAGIVDIKNDKPNDITNETLNKIEGGDTKRLYAVWKNVMPAMLKPGDSGAGDVKSKGAVSYQKGTKAQYEAARADSSITINEIQTNDYSPQKVYQWTDNDKNAYWWSEADTVYMNPDSDRMFSNCSSLTSLDVSGFDTSNVTDMSYMFGSCYNLTSLDVSGFDTSNVTNMRYMFRFCCNLTSLDVSSFDTSNVTDMTYMFGNCYVLTSLDVSSFDTSNVINMSYMFNSCYGLTSLDVSSFDTSNVMNMYCMFGGCYNLISLDVSGFDTSKVTNMSYMFNGCTTLANIYAGDGWNTSKVTNSLQMFESCSKLPNFDSSYIDKTRAYYGGDEEGYLTYKAAA